MVEIKNHRKSIKTNKFDSLISQREEGVRQAILAYGEGDSTVDKKSTKSKINISEDKFYINKPSIKKSNNRNDFNNNESLTDILKLIKPNRNSTIIRSHGNLILFFLNLYNEGI